MRFPNPFRRKPAFSAPLAPDAAFWAIGDIHGRADLLETLLGRMAARAPDLPRIFLGDYVDRGEESADVLAMLRAEQARDDHVVCLKGNHEQMFLDFLEDPAGCGPRWQRHGGLQTLGSFGIPPRSETAGDAEWTGARDKIRETMEPGTEDWLRALPVLWQSGNVCALHAGADPLMPIPGQDEETLLWGHPEFENRVRQDGTWVVHGHTIVEKARPYRGRIPVDTGAYATDRLTAALIAPGEVELVST